jgi:hypothetical protein
VRILAVIAVALILSACRADASTRLLLAEGWDTATDVAVMTIPAACPAQRIEYRAWQKDKNTPASVEFVISQMSSEVLATASGDFTDYTIGAADWTLEAGQVYALTVRGINARWRFAVTCR